MRVRRFISSQTLTTEDGHRNICRGTTRWDLSKEGGHNSTRDFDTIADMNDAIVKGINDMVGQDDWLVCLGDWSFGGIQNIWNFRQRIICKNIIEVLGNHDHHIANNKVLPNCGVYQEYDNEGNLTYEQSETYAQDLFKGVYSYLELTINDQRNWRRTYNLFHFPITIWNKAHHDRIHLYGHVHGGHTATDRSMDVGMDNAFEMFGEYRPFTEKEIQAYMKGREYNKRSHHNSKTN